MSDKKLNIEEIESKIIKIKTVGFEVPETIKQKILTSIKLNKMKRENKSWLRKLFNPTKYKKPFLVSASAVIALVGTFFVPELINKDKDKEVTNTDGVQKIIIRGKKVSAQSEENKTNFANLSEDKNVKLALTSIYGFDPDLYNIVEVPSNLDLEAPDYIYKLHTNKYDQELTQKLAYSLGFTDQDRVTKLCSQPLKDYMDAMSSSSYSEDFIEKPLDSDEFEVCLWGKNDISYYNEKNGYLSISNDSESLSSYISYYNENEMAMENPGAYSEIDESRNSDSENIENIKKLILETNLVPEEALNSFSVTKSWESYTCPEGEETYYSEESEEMEVFNSVIYPDSCAIYSYDGISDPSPISTVEMAAISRAETSDNYVYYEESDKEPKITENKPKLYITSYTLSFGNYMNSNYTHDYYSNSILSFDINYKGEIINMHGSPIEKVEEISLESISADKTLEMLLSGSVQPSYYYQMTNEIKDYNGEFSEEILPFSLVSSTTDSEGNDLNYPNLVEENPTLKEIVKLQNVNLIYELIYGNDFFYVIPSYSFEGVSTYVEDPLDKAARLDNTKKSNCTELNAVMNTQEYQEKWNSIWDEYNKELEEYYSQYDYDDLTQEPFMDMPFSEEQMAWEEQRCYVFDEYYQPNYEYPYQISVPAFANLEIQIEP